MHVLSLTKTRSCNTCKARLSQYITDLHIRYACDLLTKGEDSVTQVCFQVGFENVSHFIQAFKKLRNQPPFEFRRKKIVGLQIK